MIAAPDHTLEPVAWAAGMVDTVQRANSAIENLDAQAHQLRGELDQATNEGQLHKRAALFWEARATSLERALGAWLAYDRASRGVGGKSGLSRARAYCAALVATREALAGMGKLP